MNRTRQCGIHWCVFVVVVILVFLSWLGRSARAQERFPGKEWQRKTPAEVGLNAAQLDEFKQIVGGRGCIIRDGYLVDSWGAYTEPHDLASAVKPFYSFLLLKAREEGRIDSFDEKVVKWQPSLAKINANMSYKDGQMTFRHLGNQTACLGYRDVPGSAFDYNDATMGFFWDTIVNKVYGVAWQDAERLVLAPRLSVPLQFQDGTPGVYRQGRGKTGRFALSARDFCRFGLLFLHKGKWRDEQLLREDLAVMAVTDPLPLTIPRTKAEEAESVPEARSIGGGGNQCDHNGCYSWMWWLNRTARDGQLWFKDVPPEFFACFGHGGEEGMAVLPSQRIIVSWIGRRLHEDRERGNRAFKTLVAATRPAGPKKGQIVVDPEHPARMVYADVWENDSNYPGGKRLKPCVFVGPGDPEDFFWNDTTANLALLKQRKARCTYITAELRDFGGGSLPAGAAMEPVLEKWDRLITELENAGIITVFFFLDDGGRRDDWPDFVDRIVAKLQHHRLLIWCVAEEYGELGKDSQRLMTAMASRIKEKDTLNHIVGVHQNYGVDFDFTGEPTLDMFLMQLNDQNPRSIHDACARAWRNLAGKHILNMSECSNHSKEGDATFRQLNWASAMGGASAVQALFMGRAGDDKQWNREERYAACALQMDFFESTDVNYMSPGDHVGFAGTEHVLANPGISYIAYARQLRGKMGLRTMKAGRYDLKWIDCATGEIVVQEDVLLREGDFLFTKPPGLGSEVAVHVRRKR